MGKCVLIQGNRHSNIQLFMSLALKRNEAQEPQDQQLGDGSGLARFVPAEVYPLNNPQTDLPRIAKDKNLIQLIEEAVRRIPTTQSLNLGDARGMSGLAAGSVQLVVTSPPYWTLKEYRDSKGQMGTLRNTTNFSPNSIRCGPTVTGRLFQAGA